MTEPAAQIPAGGAPLPEAPAPGADAGDGAPAPSGPPPPEPRAPGPARGIRSLSRRTLAICVCVATIGALLAALVASALLDDTADERTEQTAELEPMGAVDLDRMLSVALTTVDGQPTTLAAQLDSRPMVLNIWAQSCVPCVEEMPLLEAAHQANPDVAFLGVDTQDRLDRALELAAQTGITCGVGSSPPAPGRSPTRPTSRGGSTSTGPRRDRRAVRPGVHRRHGGHREPVRVRHVAGLPLVLPRPRSRGAG